MAGLPTTQRDQLLFAIGFIAIIGGGAYWYFVDSPKQDELAKTQIHLDTLNAQNQRAKAQLARGTVTAVKAEAESLRANLEVLRTLVPAGNEVPALMDQISNATRRVKLELSTFDPEPPIEGELFDTYRFKVRLNAPYHDIGQVLANIASLNRVVTPINLSLQLAGATPGAAAAAAKAGPGRQMLAASFELQTYVVRTAPKAAPKPPPKPAAAKPEAEK
jgi:type IV pilus assembly protein PilO